MLPILTQSLWRDEAFSVLLAEKNPLEIIRLTIQDTTPPLHYILLHYWMLLFGNGEVATRSLSLFFHVLTAITVFFIARKLIRLSFAQILLPFVVLLNPFLLQYAFEARPYSLLAFLTVLAVYLVLINRNLLAGIVLTLGILTHNFGVFNFTAFAVWWLYANRSRLSIKEGLGIMGFPLLTILLWGSVIWNQWTKVAEGFWIKQTTSSIFLHSFEQYTRGDLSYPIQPMLYTITLILTFFAFSYWVWKKIEEDTKPILLLFFLLILPTLITYLISALFAPIYHERYLIATVPVLILITGYSLYKLYHANPNVRSALIAFIAIYTVLLIQASEQIIAATTKPAINWGVGQILSKAQSGDFIVPESTLNFLETKYYVKKSGSDIPVLAYQPDGKIPFYLGTVLFEPQEIITEMPKNRRVWQLKSDGGYELITTYRTGN